MQLKIDTMKASVLRFIVLLCEAILITTIISFVRTYFYQFTQFDSFNFLEEWLDFFYCYILYIFILNICLFVINNFDN